MSSFSPDQRPSVPAAGEGAYPSPDGVPAGEDLQVTAAFLELEEAQLRASRTSWRRTLGWAVALLVGLGALGQAMPLLF